MPKKVDPPPREDGQKPSLVIRAVNGCLMIIAFIGFTLIIVLAWLVSLGERSQSTDDEAPSSPPPR